MAQHQHLTRPERARITEIQDMLIERFVEFKEATDSEDVSRAESLFIKIENLRSEKEDIETWATAGRESPHGRVHARRIEKIDR